MVPSLLTAANWPIVGQLCWILGKVMNFIYNFLDNCLPSDNGLVGLSIILYTIFCVYVITSTYSTAAENIEDVICYESGDSGYTEEV